MDESPQPNQGAAGPVNQVTKSDGSKAQVSTELKAPTQIGQGFRDAAQQRVYDKRQDQRMEAQMREQETKVYGQDISGQNGVAGVIDAVRGIAKEEAAGMLRTLRIIGGDGIAASGSGPSWSLALKSKVQPTAQLSSEGTVASSTIRPWTPSIVSGQLKFTPYSPVRDMEFNDMDVDGLTDPFDCPDIGDAVWLSISIDNTADPAELAAAIHMGSFPGEFVSDPNVSSPFQTQINLLLLQITDPDTDGRPGFDFDGKHVVQMFSRGVSLIYGNHAGISVVMVADPAYDFPVV